MATNPTYYRGDLRRDLLDAAIEAIAHDGPAAVSLRSVAKSVGVSHAAPQTHFGDKSGLFAAIAAEGFERLLTTLTTPPANGPSDAVTHLGVQYVRFALDHPAHFAVMWNPDLHRDPPAVAHARDSTFAALLDTLSAVEGDLDDDAAIARGERAWIVAHGLATLLLSGALTPPVGTEPMQYVADQLEHLDLGSPAPPSATTRARPRA